MDFQQQTYAAGTLIIAETEEQLQKLMNTLTERSVRLGINKCYNTKTLFVNWDVQAHPNLHVPL